MRRSSGSALCCGALGRDWHIPDATTTTIVRYPNEEQPSRYSAARRAASLPHPRVCRHGRAVCPPPERWAAVCGSRRGTKLWSGAKLLRRARGGSETSLTQLMACRKVTAFLPSEAVYEPEPARRPRKLSRPKQRHHRT